MKFILKDNLIHIVGNHGLPNNNIEGLVEAPGFEDFVLEYSVNGAPYKKLKEGKITIPKEALQTTQLDLKVKASRGQELVFFKSDTLPVLHTIILGKSIEDFFPEVIKSLLTRMENLEALLGFKTKEIEEATHSEVRSVKNIMKDMVDTFEEINRKGSLF